MPQYANDPRWITARFDSFCKRCKRKIAKGEQVFYYPMGKFVYCNHENCGQKESRAFIASAQDEDFMNGQF